MALARLTPGKIFARDFVVQALLAQGGMGAVYRAEQQSTGNAVALKIMLPDLLVDPKSRERFEHEARVAGRIKSSHVAKVVAAGIDESTQTPWLAMEYLDGQNLAELVRARGPLSSEVALATLQQVGHALAAAHAAGIVHCDLKPENLFVTASQTVGVPFEVKVLDFGIARVLREGRDSATVTTAIGSPHWLAPEQGARGRTVSPATDVWSLGLIAFWMLSGRYYWKRANVADAELNLYALLGEIAGEDPIVPASERLRALGESHMQLPRGFDEWFSRCVNRDVEARFANAGLAMDALAAAMRSSADAVPVATLTALPSVPPGLAAGSTAAMSRAPSAPAWPRTEAIAEPLPRPAAPRLTWLFAAVATVALVVGFGATATLILRRSAAEPTATVPPALVVPVTSVATPSELAPRFAPPGDPLPRPPTRAVQAEPSAPIHAPAPIAPHPPEPALGRGLGQGEVVRERVIHGSAAAGSGDSTGGEGQVDTSAVSRIIRGQIGGIRACYERELHNTPTLSGRLEMSFTIGSNGRITSITAGGPLASAAPAVGSCVSDRLRGLVFPAPEGGSVEFQFPFTFSPSS